MSIRPVGLSSSLSHTSNSLLTSDSLVFGLGDASNVESLAETSSTQSPYSNELEVNSSFILKEIYFDLDKSILLQQSYQELLRLQNLLVSHPSMRIEIIGHTDDQGSAAYNQRLSEERAKSVVDYLVKKGIHPRRLSYQGRGESQPLFANDSDEHRALNRRVEFRIVGL